MSYRDILAISCMFFRFRLHAETWHGPTSVVITRSFHGDPDSISRGGVSCAYIFICFHAGCWRIVCCCPEYLKTEDVIFQFFFFF